MVMDYRQDAREINYHARYDALWELITHRREAEKILEGSLAIPSITDFNFTDIHGYSLLAYACAMGDIDTVHKLLTLLNVDIDQTTRLCNKNPMQLALEFGHLNIAKILKNSGAKIQIELANITSAACHEWAFEVLESILLTRTTRPEIRMYLCVCLNKLAYLKTLKEDYPREFFHILAGQSYTSTLTPLVHTAIVYGHTDIVEYLLTGAIGLTTHGFQPDILFHAIEVGQYTLAEKFIDRYRQLRINLNRTNRRSQSPLILASIANEPALFAKLLKAYVNLRTTDYLGNNFLHYIAQNNNAVLFELLQRHYPEQLHALCRQKNNVGKIPLEIAQDCQHDALTQRLKLTSPAPYLSATRSTSPNHTSIKSEVITRHLNYFLLMNYQEECLFSEDRINKILSLLFLHYHYQNKADYFYYCLNVIAQWDGCEDALEETLKDTPAHMHGVCESLFQKWIEDILQCQQRLSDTSQTYAQQSTQHIGFQHRLRSFLSRGSNPRMVAAAPRSFIILNNTTPLTICDEPKNITLNAMSDTLEQFIISPEGTCLEIRNSIHSCMLYRLAQERIAIYDPCSEFRLRVFDKTADLTSLISKIFASSQDKFSHPVFVLATNVYRFETESTLLRPDANLS